MTGADRDLVWYLATMRRHEPDARDANVTINCVRQMEEAEVASVRDALNPMGYVSAHALTEPIRRVANNLGRFVHSIVTADKPPELLATHTEATIAFDGAVALSGRLAVEVVVCRRWPGRQRQCASSANAAGIRSRGASSMASS